MDKIDDLSIGFHRIRPKLVDENGISYMDFLRTLSPNYNIVYRDIFFGYFGLVATLLIAAVILNYGINQYIAVGLVSIFVGYFIAYLQLFIHEAAHKNVAVSANMNDLISDLFIGWMIGTSVSKYRIVHHKHHRYLGTIDDSEHSYFFPLNVVFIARNGFLIRPIEIFIKRIRIAANGQNGDSNSRNDETNQKGKMTRRDLLVFTGGVFAHIAIIAALYSLHGTQLALVWIVGLVFFFPLFGALRQLLEHRDNTASSAIDYFVVPHGHFTRMFDGSFLARTFGGAGFNKHLLHHWEPSISYTNFDDLESFLLKTEVGKIINVRKTSYMDAIKELAEI